MTWILYSIVLYGIGVLIGFMWGKEQKMTREEALQILDTIPTISEQVDALEMAIQALSQEPCDDAISRKDIQDYIAKYLSQYLYEDVRQAVEVIDAYIGDMPSVTQKTGKWIKKEDDTCWWYACSECEQEPLKNRWNDDDVLSAFCPNCGAKMVEPQESEE